MNKKFLISNFKFQIIFLIFLLFLSVFLIPNPYTSSILGSLGVKDLYPTYAVSQEEQAIYSINNGIFPDEVKTRQEPSNILISITNTLKDLLGIFLNSPENKEKTYSNSENLQQATVPEKYKPPDNGGLLNIKKFLGTSVGFYGEELPPQMQTDNVGQSEKNYQQANFPDGIKPITGQ